MNVNRRGFLKLAGYSGIVLSNLSIAGAAIAKKQPPTINGVVRAQMDNPRMFPLAQVRAVSSSSYEMEFNIFASVGNTTFDPKYCQYLGHLIIPPNDVAMVQITLPPEPKLNFFIDPEKMYPQVELDISIKPYTYKPAGDGFVEMTFDV